MSFVTSVLNEWGQFVTTVAVASESEGCYQRMARGLIARFKRANAPAPKVLYADNHCCRSVKILVMIEPILSTLKDKVGHIFNVCFSDAGTSFYGALFSEWIDEGCVVRLDIRHWLHRWDKVVIKQTHAKYPLFMSSMAGAVLAYNKEDMTLLIQAVRAGNPDLYSKRDDDQMMGILKPHQVKSYVRRVTRGVNVSYSYEHVLIAFLYFYLIILLLNFGMFVYCL